MGKENEKEKKRKIKKKMRKKSQRIAKKIPHSRNTSGPAERTSVCVNMEIGPQAGFVRKLPPHDT